MMTSLLILIDQMGVADYFETRLEPVLRKIFVLIAQTFIEYRKYNFMAFLLF